VECSDGRKKELLEGPYAGKPGAVKHCLKQVFKSETLFERNIMDAVGTTTRRCGKHYNLTTLLAPDVVGSLRSHGPVIRILGIDLMKPDNGSFVGTQRQTLGVA
jgi:hypothetical protein